MKTLRLCLFTLMLALLPACGESPTQPEVETGAASAPTSGGPQMSGGWLGSGT